MRNACKVFIRNKILSVFHFFIPSWTPSWFLGYLGKLWKLHCLQYRQSFLIKGLCISQVFFQIWSFLMLVEQLMTEHIPSSFLEVFAKETSTFCCLYSNGSFTHRAMAGWLVLSAGNKGSESKEEKEEDHLLKKLPQSFSACPSEV